MKNNNQREGLSRKKECTRAYFNTPTLWPFGQEATQRTSYQGLFLISTLERRGGTFMYPRRQETVNLISVGRTRRACCTCETLKKYEIVLDTFWAFLNMFPFFSKFYTCQHVFILAGKPVHRRASRIRTLSRTKRISERSSQEIPGRSSSRNKSLPCIYWK